MYGFYGEGLKIPDNEKHAIAQLNGALLRQAIQSGSKLPSRLYQYTSALGLKGLIESGCVHATHIAFMNDKSEYQIGVTLFEEILSSGRQALPELSALFDEMARRISGTSPFNYAPAFVACFSAERNDLNQWRAYAGTSGGYCVGFNAQKLWSRAYSSGGFLAPVIYNRETAKQLVSRFFEGALAEYRRVAKKYTGKAQELHRSEWVTALFALSSNLLPILKHESFRAEHEWRVVYPLRFTTEVKTKPRIRTNILCPYVELKLGEANQYPAGWPANSPGRLKALPDLLPIEEILAGSSEDEELSQISARAILESHAYGGVTVGQSKLPFRTTS
jgi:hypothetical protein